MKFTFSPRERKGARPWGRGRGRAYSRGGARLGGVTRFAQNIREESGSWWSSLRGGHGKEASGGTVGCRERPGQSVREDFLGLSSAPAPVPSPGEAGRKGFLLPCPRHPRPCGPGCSLLTWVSEAPSALGQRRSRGAPGMSVILCVRVCVCISGKLVAGDYGVEHQLERQGRGVSWPDADSQCLGRSPGGEREL